VGEREREREISTRQGRTRLHNPRQNSGLKIVHAKIDPEVDNFPIFTKTPSTRHFFVSQKKKPVLTQPQEPAELS
jgi:hypothetical protein